MECSTETQLRRGPLRCACEWNRDSPKLVKQIGAEFAYPREIEFVDQLQELWQVRLSELS